jgi:hypothetical protein
MKNHIKISTNSNKIYKYNKKQEKKATRTIMEVNLLETDLTSRKCMNIFILKSK